MPGQRRGEVDGAGPLSAVETPYRFWNKRIQVNRFRPVAPARCDREGDADARALKLLCGAGRLRNATDAGIGNDTLHRQAAGVSEILGEQVGRGPGHAHRLLFQRLPNASPPAIDGRSNPNFRQRSTKPVYRRQRLHPLNTPHRHVPPRPRRLLTIHTSDSLASEESACAGWAPTLSPKGFGSYNRRSVLPRYRGLVGHNR